MSIVMFEGFDAITGDVGLAMENTGHFDVVTTLTAITGADGSGLGVYANAGESDMFKLSIPDTPTEVIVGFALYNNGIYGGIRFRTTMYETDGGSAGTGLSSMFVVDNAGAVSVQGVATGYNVPSSAWTYIEIRFLQHPSAGEIEVKANGTQIYSGTGLDTSSDQPLGHILFRGGNTAYVDDIYLINVSDATGQVGFLGPVNIKELPLDGQGGVNNWTADTTNYLDVDDSLPDDGDTSKVTATATGQVDRYSVADITENPETIYAVQVTSRMKTDTGSANVRNLIHDGANVQNGATDSVISSYSAVNDVFETAPDAGAWDKTKVQALEVGVEWVS